MIFVNNKRTKLFSHFFKRNKTFERFHFLFLLNKKERIESDQLFFQCLLPLDPIKILLFIKKKHFFLLKRRILFVLAEIFPIANSLAYFVLPSAAHKKGFKTFTSRNLFSRSQSN
jgi:hypothetical protein